MKRARLPLISCTFLTASTTSAVVGLASELFVFLAMLTPLQLAVARNHVVQPLTRWPNDGEPFSTLWFEVTSIMGKMSTVLLFLLTER